jgi:Secretion system C-terminal sorting domain/Viral BACON domain
MKNFLSLLSFFLLLSGFVLNAQVVEEIIVNPSSPQVGQAFTITLKGKFPNQCFQTISLNRATVWDDEIDLNLKTTQTAPPCGQALKPFSLVINMSRGISYTGEFCIKITGGASISTSYPPNRCFEVKPQPTGPFCERSSGWLECGRKVNGTTWGEQNRLTSYECLGDGWHMYGPEKVYRLEIKSAQEVCLDLDILDSGLDLDMFLLRDVCRSAWHYPKALEKDCIESSVGGGTRRQSICTRLEPGSYLVVIDSKHASHAGKFSLGMSCRDDDMCSKAQDIKCGAVLKNQTTIGSGNGVFQWICGDGAFDMFGNDRVYRIKLDKPGSIYAEMDISSPNQNLRMMLAKDICTMPGVKMHHIPANACVTQADENFLTNIRTLRANVPAGSYLLVVDAAMAMTTANFNLKVSCDTIPCNLKTSRDTIDFSFMGGNQTLNISAAGPWSAAPVLSWLTLSPSSGVKNGSMNLNVIRNDDAGQRQQIIKLSCGTETKNVLVRQRGRTSAQFNPSDGGTAGNLGSVSIFPNPSQGLTSLSINSPVSGEALIQVFDLQGKEVLAQSRINLYKGQNQQEIGTERLMPGTYIVRVQTPSLNQAIRLLVQ